MSWAEWAKSEGWVIGIFTFFMLAILIAIATLGIKYCSKMREEEAKNAWISDNKQNPKSQQGKPPGPISPLDDISEINQVPEKDESSQDHFLADNSQVEMSDVKIAYPVMNLLNITPSEIASSERTPAISEVPVFGPKQRLKNNIILDESLVHQMQVESKLNIFESEVDDGVEGLENLSDGRESYGTQVESRTIANFADYSINHAKSEQLSMRGRPFKYDKFIKSGNKVKKVDMDNSV